MLSVRDIVEEEYSLLKGLTYIELNPARKAQFQQDLEAVAVNLGTVRKSYELPLTIPLDTFIKEHTNYTFLVKNKLFMQIAHQAMEACKQIDFLESHATEVDVEACRDMLLALYYNCLGSHNRKFQELAIFMAQLKMASEKVGQGKQVEARLLLGNLILAEDLEDLDEIIMNWRFFKLEIAQFAAFQAKAHDGWKGIPESLRFTPDFYNNCFKTRDYAQFHNFVDRVMNQLKAAAAGVTTEEKHSNAKAWCVLHPTPQTTTTTPTPGSLEEFSKLSLNSPRR